MRSLVLGLLQQLVVALLLTDISAAQDYCGQAVYNATLGTINFPPYFSRQYLPNTNCTYNIKALKLSRIHLTIQWLDVEIQQRCNFDWVQIRCISHQVEFPSRFCGHIVSTDVVFSLCSELRIDFHSDQTIQGNGFSIDYVVDEIECVGNCTPVSNSYGYVCPCDTNGTNATLPTAPPSPSCLSNCILSTNQSLCLCPESGQSTSTFLTCPPGCFSSLDFFGQTTCDCTHSTTPSPATCSPGCYRTTDYLGYPYCNCPSATNPSVTCPYGCHADTDYFGNRYCNCPTSTEAPLWCSPECTSAVDASGSRYCNCPTSTIPPCYSPCYYRYADVTYCYCPTTATNPPPTGCDQALTTTSGIVMSPNYPNAYPKGIDCTQQILVPMATAIKLILTDMDVLYSNAYSCIYEYIEITGCDGSHSVFCSTINFPTTGLIFQCTDSSSVTINFHSYIFPSSYSYRGFKLLYSANFGSNCSDSGVQLFNGGMGYLTSPNFPNSFPSYIECFTYIFTEDDVKIRITFEQLRLDDTSICEKVSLTFSCQDDSSIDGSDSYQEICVSLVPSPITFDCRVLQIWFRSNTTRATSLRGYKMIYYGISKQPSTTIGPNGLMQGNANGNDLSESSRLGIGLGVGVGGFFLLILIAIIIVLIVLNQRQMARRDAHPLENIAVVSRSMNGSQEDAGGRLQSWNNSPSGGGFVNPIHEGQQYSSDDLPTYQSTTAENLAEASSVGDFTTEKPKAKLLD